MTLSNVDAPITRAARGGAATSRAHALNRASLFRLAGLAALVPRPARLALARGLATTLAASYAGEARIVDANLARVVPSASPAARARLRRELFAHFAMCFADLITTNRRRAAPDLVVPGDGDEHVGEILASGGFIVLTAHVGNWELAGRTLVARGDGRPLHVVMAPEADPGVERLMRSRDAPVRFVTLRSPTDALPLVAALRRGEIVGMQGDRPRGDRGDVACEFFGAPAAFPLGPFLLARAAGVPVLPAFCVLRSDRRYAVHLRPPLRVERGDEARALRGWVDALASVVARHPTQWFHFSDPWSSASAH